MHVCIYQHLSLHFRYFSMLSNLPCWLQQRQVFKFHNFFYKFVSTAEVCVLYTHICYVIYICCDIDELVLLMWCTLLGFVSLLTWIHFSNPLHVVSWEILQPLCSVLKITKYGSSDKELSFSVNIMLPLLIPSASAFSCFSYPRLGLCNSLWYLLFLREGPSLSMHLLSKTFVWIATQN